MTSSKMRQPGGRKTPCDGKGECSLCNRYDCYYRQGSGYCPACGMPEGSCKEKSEKEVSEDGKVKQMEIVQMLEKQNGGKKEKGKNEDDIKYLQY